MIRIKTHIRPHSKASCQDLYDRMRELPEGEYKVFVTDQKNTRSSQQNKFYWGVVLPVLAGHTGYRIDEMHDICKYKFNKGVFTDPETGEVLDIGKSTTTLKVDEFVTYIGAIKQWSLEALQCLIPDAENLPDEITVLHES